MHANGSGFDSNSALLARARESDSRHLTTRASSGSYPSLNHPPQGQATHVSESDSDTSYAALSSIPLLAWETQTPVLDALIRETLRLAQPHVAMRRNVGPEVFIDGKSLPTGAFAIYPFSDVHLDKGIYEDPWKWDPGRKECKKELGYIGWGGGMFIFFYFLLFYFLLFYFLCFSFVGWGFAMCS